MKSRLIFLATGSTTLALASATFFAAATLADAILLTPPPFAYHAQVVVYGQAPGPVPRRVISTALYDAVGTPLLLLSRGMATAAERVSARAGGHAAVVAMQRVDAGYLPTLGVAPAAGSLALDAGGHDAALVSWRLWQAWFGGGQQVGGQVIMVDGRVFPVGGVLPPTFRVFDDIDVFLPLRPVSGGAAGDMANELAVGRLAPGATVEAFGEAVRGAVAARTGIPGMPGDDMASFGATPIDAALRGYAAPALWSLLGASILVVATACGTLTNLVHARAMGRGRDMAMRMAFGAMAWRAAWPVVRETALVATMGLAGALALGGVLVRAVREALPRYWLLDAMPVAASWRVFAATGILTGATAALAALAGTWHARGDSLLREHMGAAGARPRGLTAQRVRVAAMQAQLAFATILSAACAKQVIASWDDWRPPADAVVRGIALARFHPDTAHFDSMARIAALADALARDGPRRDGITAAGVTTQLPTGPRFVVAFPGIHGEPVEVRLALQSVGARAAMGLRLLAGRDIGRGDTAGSEAVIVVNQAFLAAVRGAVLGHTVDKVSRSLGNRSLRIVGVVGNDRTAGDGAATQPEALMPLAQLPAKEFSAYRGLLSYYVVALASDAAHTLRGDPGLGLHDIAPWLVAEPSTLAAEWHDSAALAHRGAWNALLLAILAVSLGVIGLCSALRVQLDSRQRDLALVAALGASPWRLCVFAMGRPLPGAAVGITVGMAFVVAWLRPWSEAALAAAVGGVFALCGLAALPFLARAAATDPWRAVREP